MGRLRCSFFLLLATLITGCLERGFNEALRDELSARAVTDQAIRDTIVQVIQPRRNAKPERRQRPRVRASL